MNPNYNVQVLEKTIYILETMAKYPYGISLGELTAEVNLNKSTVFRILATLEEHGYVAQVPTDGKYKLNYKFLILANSVMERMEIQRVAHPYLDELSRVTGEVTHLVVQDACEGVYIDKVDNSKGTIRMYSKIGGRVHLHSTSVGKVLLSALEPEKVKAIIKQTGLPARTNNTITDIELLSQELTGIRAKGYAVDDVENEENIRCVAAPIFDYKGDVVAAISISGTTLRIKSDDIPRLAAIVKEYALRISGELGYNQE